MLKAKGKSLFIVMLLVVLSLTACGGGTGNKADQGGKQTIRFATWDSEDNLTLQQELIDKFNEQHPDIQVNLEAYGSDYDTKITAGMGAKDAPDVMYMWNYPTYKDALEPLDPYIEKEGSDFKDNFYDTLWNYNSADDQILGLPVGYTTHVVYYNKDLFDAAGIPYPQDGWTWEDLQADAKKLANDAESISGFAFSGKPDPYDYEMFLWGNGASYVDDQGNLEGNLNSPKSIEVLTMFQNMLKEGYAITTEGSGATEMKSGKVAMFTNGAWSIGSLREAGINFGVVELPKSKDGSAISIVSSSGISMSKESSKKDAAWEFIKFWTSEEANKARIDYELPVLKSVVESENLKNDELKKVFYHMLEMSEKYTPASFKVDNWSEISERLELAFESIFNPSTLMDPKAVLDDAAQ
ncbi:ABC transporter substrate-binding protein [Paenibacillus lutimineralis]|uniref:Sugar ABC transporter substrate-binding protein n=1 Tax=Paenibacillus lutimineralis TaxID=2707005 RepID=A0A3S9V1Z7_9BACL|nr:sugar ABC transporter substrate-binding protein [Paenibacillus lutimineralis]AZS16516.1 sugar ABC transporter substrate-binding protein [Paenibacillus lutimineralis]